MEKLLKAAHEGDIDELNRVIGSVDEDEVEVFVNSQRPVTNICALHLAAKGGYYDICENLFEAGADLDLTNTDERTPLHFAAMNGFSDICKYFVENGAILDPRDKGENDIVEILLKYGVKVNTKRRTDIPPILFAIEVASKDESKADAIVQCISTLIGHNADINCAFINGNNAGETPLISAARLDKFDLAKMLLEKNADASAVSKSGKTAFYYATDKKNAELLKLLIDNSKDKEADLNRRYENNMTLAHVTLQKITSEFLANKAIKILELLFENNVDPDSTDDLGDTPLHIAAKNDTAKDIVTLLIHKGCNPQQTNYSERTVFSVAHKKMIPIIIKASNEEESIDAMNEREEIKRERELEEMERRRSARDSQLITNTPSEYGEKKVDSKKKTQLLAMTKRGGTLRTPKHSTGTKYTSVKKMEARAWGGSKQAAKFQRDTRLKIRKIKEEVLEQLKRLREEVEKIQKKINVDAGNISESEEHSNTENDDLENENDQNSSDNDLPPPGTELNYSSNNINDNNSIHNNEDDNEALDLGASQTMLIEEEDKLDLIKQPQINDEDEELNLQDQQHTSNNENNFEYNPEEQPSHNDDNDFNLDIDGQNSHNNDNDINLDVGEHSNNEEDIDIQLSDNNAPTDGVDDLLLNDESPSNIDLGE